MAVLVAVIGMGIVFDVEQATGESIAMPVVSGTAVDYADRFVREDEVLGGVFQPFEYRDHLIREVDFVVDSIDPVEIIETVSTPTPTPTPISTTSSEFVSEGAPNVDKKNLDEIEDLISQIEDELSELEDLDLLLDF